MKTLTTMLAAAAAVACFSAAADAATITIDVITAKWSNVSLDGPGSVTQFRNDGTSDNPEIRWGQSTGSGQSGYVFDGRNTPISTPEDTDFVLGDFTHNNFPINGSALASARLDITAQLKLDGNPISGGPFFFSFQHNETANHRPCNPPGATVCPDVVSISSVSQGQTFKIGDKDYTLAFAGFQVNGNTVSQFVTEEGQSNTAQLIGRFSVAEVPLPAAGWLLVSALGGLGVMSRRRRHDTDASAA